VFVHTYHAWIHVLLVNFNTPAVTVSRINSCKIVLSVHWQCCYCWFYSKTDICNTHLWPWGTLSSPEEGASPLGIHSVPRHAGSRTWFPVSSYWDNGNLAWFFGPCCTHADRPLVVAWSHVFGASTWPAIRGTSHEQKRLGNFHLRDSINEGISWPAELISASKNKFAL
jgi:hypothetical protein